ncbi:TetR/AcrR family transcriptional regulator [Pantoea stewartii]|uniref:TetR family transcriptional regulator n=1 Tax=Pantoea stewartii TaxID=66269 RepID=A0AB34VGG2_9GAMM|nr:TetR/AcrR family transcriptional regulator [Pantoea stewartii]KTS74813.1 TetR family transcriptional regulator [Pantoea stewartii]KTS98066.1 TetR family transcriptional regulator [Pantoea stewartii]KTT05047.1 TetR family transcriptional regulator [Pantoea stewartii]
MAKSDTRKRLLNAGVRVFMREGYEGSGITTILGEAGMPKGSFYNLFSSKEEFACAALDVYIKTFDALRENTLLNTALVPRQRLINWLSGHREYIEREPEAGGCLAGIIGQTGAVHSEKMRQKLLAIFSAWERDLINIFTDAQQSQTLSPRMSPESAAMLVIHSYEGVMIRIRIARSLSPYAFLMQTLPDLLFAESDAV